MKIRLDCLTIRERVSYARRMDKESASAKDVQKKQSNGRGETRREAKESRCRLGIVV